MTEITLNQETINRLLDVNDTFKIIMIIQAFVIALFVSYFFIRWQQKNADKANEINKPININDIVVGTEITAIDKCEMIGKNENALTVGKKYSVNNVVSDGFNIKDDQGYSHHFLFEDCEKIFNLTK